MENQAIDILDLIPHRVPFIMIDTIKPGDNRNILSSFYIAEDNILLEQDHFSESGLIENMAQTAGAGSGYISSLDPGPGRVGYIGGLKNLHIYAFPKAGSIIQTEVSFVNQVMSALIVEGKVYQDEKLMASCELRIFIQS